MNVIETCEQCRPYDPQGCPLCGHNCDLVAKTIHDDEDAHCDRCNVDLLHSADGFSLVQLQSGEP